MFKSTSPLSLLAGLGALLLVLCWQRPAWGKNRPQT